MRHITGLHKALLVMHAPTDDTVGIDNATRIFVTAKHPKSFVSLADADHLLQELLHLRPQIDGRIDAKKWGIERFRMMPAVGDSPAFIAALQDIVLKALGITEEKEELRAAG